MKRRPIFITATVMSLFLAVNIKNALAQKQPAVQQTSLRAPANVKVDGKNTEWGTQLQAHNPTSRVFYTLSNDKDNLYLIVRMEDKHANNKAIIGGITLTINPKSKNKIAVTFPVAGGKEKNMLSDLVYDAEDTKDAKKLDSLIKVVNKTIVASFKQIGISGIKEINEPTIPIYNAQGIQVAANFDDQKKYVFEAALPLKYFENLIDVNGKMQYNIKMNGTVQTGPGQGTLIIPVSATSIFTTPNSLYQAHPTDFSGEYTLTK